MALTALTCWELQFQGFLLGYEPLNVKYFGFFSSGLTKLPC